ncbi:sodium-dependent transporter [bacterium]|nr:sodium-dependent transporter [bacterium]
MANTIDKSVNQRFNSRLGLLLSALGVAVGTGNIWRFPRIAASNGGEAGAGALIIAWIIFLFLWSVPLIIAEYAIGRKQRRGVIGSIALTAGKRFTWMGTFIAFVATAICFFYSVVVGWCIYYFIHMLVHPLPLTTEASVAVWNQFQNSYWPLVFHAGAMGFGAFAIWKGVSSIEKVNKILIPTLLGIVLLSVVRALTLQGAWSGVAYLFTPQWQQLLQPRIWLEALTQNAWDTGAGWGLFLTYAAYMKKEHGAVKNAFTTAVGNNTVSILAALMIFGTVFAVLQTEMGMARPEILGIMKESGPAATGLTFIWMPQLFARMFLGHPLCVLFFLGLTFAGFSSLIAMLELPTRVMVDAGFKRATAIPLVIGFVYLLGIPSARNLTFLTNQDFVWGNALVVSGAFIAFTLMRYGLDNMRTNELLADKTDWNIGRWWVHDIRYVVPAGAVILLVWWFSQAAQAGDWADPFGQYSLMTNLVQWSLLIVMLLLANRWMSKRLVP